MSATAWVGGRVLLPDASGFRDATVHVAQGRIVAIDSSPATGDEAVVDVRGRFVLPGLIDSHYHLVSRSSEYPEVSDIAVSTIEGVVNAESCIASGVTSVRDCGCRHAGIYTLQRAVEVGAIVGPRAVTAGRNPTGESAPRHWRNVFAAGPDEMRAAVREQVEAGAGWIKLILAHAFDPLRWDAVTVFMSDEEIAAAVDEAHRCGVRIGAHCEGWEVAERGIRLGLDSLDHAPLLSDAAVEAMAVRRVTYTPTVWAFSSDAGVDVDALPEAERDRLLAWRQEHRESVRRAFAAGVPIAAGSDSASAVTGPGVLVDELEALRDCGLPPAAVLAAGTVRGAEAMGSADSVGSLAPGLRADIVVVDGDPLERLDALRAPRAVWQDGVLRFVSGRGVVPDAVRRLDEAVVARWV